MQMNDYERLQTLEQKMDELAVLIDQASDYDSQYSLRWDRINAIQEYALLKIRMIAEGGHLQ